MAEKKKETEDVAFEIGDHYNTWSSSERNELIKSGEWKELMLTDKGKYVLEKVT